MGTIFGSHSTSHISLALFTTATAIKPYLFLAPHRSNSSVNQPPQPAAQHCSTPSVPSHEVARRQYTASLALCITYVGPFPPPFHLHHPSKSPLQHPHYCCTIHHCTPRHISSRHPPQLLTDSTPASPPAAYRTVGIVSEHIYNIRTCTLADRLRHDRQIDIIHQREAPYRQSKSLSPCPSRSLRFVSGCRSCRGFLQSFGLLAIFHRAPVSTPRCSLIVSLS